MDANQSHFVGYFSIIPANVRNDDSLSATAKLFFGDIASMAQSDGYCYASNAYFAERFGLTERSVSRTIKLLTDHGHVKVRLCRNRDTGQITGRRIYPIFNAAVPEDDEIEESYVATETGENDTLSHLTKMSTPVDKNVIEPLTKMSTGLIRKSNIKQEDNIPPISPTDKKRRKTTDDTAAREQLKQWAESLFVGAKAEALTERLMQFCDVRKEKHALLPAGTSLRAKTNKLWRLSSGRLEIMLEILDKSICNGWLDFYPLKDDVARTFEPDSAPREPQVLPKSGSYGEDGYKWL